MKNKNAQRRTRKTRPKLLLIVEGSANKSEQSYFELLARELRSAKAVVDVKVIPGKGEPSKLLKRCLTEKDRNGDRYDYYCLVVDVDEHASLPNVLKQAERNGINVVVTNPKFELWLLLHVTDVNTQLSTSQIDKLMSELNLTAGKRGKELARKFPVRNYQEACQRGYNLWKNLAPGKIGPNPSTAIPWLVTAIKRGNFNTS